MSDEKKSLEERFENLESILTEMEAEDVSLEKSFELYQKGLQEIKEANDMITEIETAMQVINEQGQLEDF